MLGQFVQLTQGSFGVGSEQRAGKRQNLALSGEAEHREDILFNDLAAAKADELIKRTLRVAHAAVGAACNGVQSRVVDLDFLKFGDVAEMFDDQGDRNSAQIETL